MFAVSVKLQMASRQDYDFFAFTHTKNTVSVSMAFEQRTRARENFCFLRQPKAVLQYPKVRNLRMKELSFLSRPLKSRFIKFQKRRGSQRHWKSL